MIKKIDPIKSIIFVIFLVFFIGTIFFHYICKYTFIESFAITDAIMGCVNYFL